MNAQNALESHWALNYVGVSYQENDCAALAVRVQKEVFGCDIRIPVERANNVHGISHQIGSLKDDYAEPTDAPEDGDAVLMIGRGRLNHVGLYALINGVPHCLHALRGAGQVCLHRIRELPNQGLTVAGYFKWK